MKLMAFIPKFIDFESKINKKVNECIKHILHLKNIIRFIVQKQEI